MKTREMGTNVAHPLFKDAMGVLVLCWKNDEIRFTG